MNIGDPNAKTGCTEGEAVNLEFTGGRWDGLAVVWDGREIHETLQVEQCDPEDKVLALVPPEIHSKRNQTYGLVFKDTERGVYVCQNR